MTDQELDSRMRSIEGALRGLPEGSCLYQYTRVMSGFNLPRQDKYANPITEAFATDRLTFLEKNAGFRRIDLHWCLTLEPSKIRAFERRPRENAADTSRMIADLQKTATILESHLGSSLGLRLLRKAEAFQFFSYLFNLEEWAGGDHLRADTGVDRQIVKNPVAWHSDYLQVGKRHVQMFSLKATPEASRPCLFSGLLTLNCDSVLCSTWRMKSTASARSEIDAQEKFISFFKVGVLTRVMSGRDTSSLETGAGAKAANNSVDDLSEVIRSLDKKAQGEYSLRLLLAARSPEQLRDTLPAVHRIFVDARAQVMEETLGNLSAFYAMFLLADSLLVNPHRDVWVGVTEQLLSRLDVDLKLSEQRCEAVPERMVSIANKSLETTYVKTNENVVKANKVVTERFIRELEISGFTMHPSDLGNPMWRRVPKALVANFVRDFAVDPANIKFQAKDLASFIANTTEEFLQEWDVVIPQGRGEQTSIGGISIRPTERSVRVYANSVLISGKSARIASPGTEQEGLPAEMVKNLIAEYRLDQPTPTGTGGAETGVWGHAFWWVAIEPTSTQFGSMKDMDIAVNH